jgi:hypothetical protein
MEERGQGRTGDRSSPGTTPLATRPAMSLPPGAREWRTRSFLAPIHPGWRRYSSGHTRGAALLAPCHRGGQAPIIDRVLHSRALGEVSGSAQPEMHVVYQLHWRRAATSHRNLQGARSC